MKRLYLTNEHVLRLIQSPDFFVINTFLEPMREPALALHKKLGASCNKCMKGVTYKAAALLSSALTALVQNEYNKPENKLGTFKEIVTRILNVDTDELVIKYNVGGKSGEIVLGESFL